MTDIVCTYVDDTNKEWQDEFNYWKNKEIKEGISQKSNRQAFGKERTRTWDAFKYWFRGIENNCKWVNKVFLIVQNKNHIPEWLNTDHPKLRIVYHDEYIPKELLPTFNAMTISTYTANIKDLSNHYILSDDDYYFLNPIEESRFFKCAMPVHPDNRVEYKYYEETNESDNVFYKILNTTLKFEERFMTKKVKYGYYHLPEARVKSFEKGIIDKYANELMEHNLPSKFRSENNLCPYMYSDLLKICNKAIGGNPYRNSAYCDLKSDVDFNKYWSKDMVCFNDTERVDDYEKTKERFIEFLDKKFPNKSSFEK